MPRSKKSFRGGKWSTVLLKNLSKVKLSSITEINDSDLMKMIFSSGDFFPGFYRYTLGTQFVGDESLSVSTLVWMFFEQESVGTTHSKEDWFELQHEIYDRDIASESARNFGNEPHVRKLINEGMMKWYFDESEYDFMYMDSESKVRSFEPLKTYYFMGSLIRFEGGLRIGYDHTSKTSVLTLDVEFSDVESYLAETFSTKHFEGLLIEAEIFGQLKFNSQKHNDNGEITLNASAIDKLLLKDQSLKVFGAPAYSRHLPIRFAKHIRFTNFKRFDDGRFHVWKTNQNW